MKNVWIFNGLAVLSLIATGCDPKDGAPEGQIAGTSGEDPSTGEQPGDPDDPAPTPDDDDGMDGTSTGEVPDDDDGSDTDEPECTFLDCPTTGDPPIGECSLWDQDCGEGEKCMPWANDGGGSWNDSRCTPLDSAPGQPGDACTVEGSGVTGIDSCDVGSMCWNVDEEGAGVCVSLCNGTQEAPLCDNPNDQCIIANDGFLPLCLPNCDPLLGCPDGEGCYPSENGFVCAPDASGPDLGGFGDACEYTNACDPSLFCAAANAVPGCESAFCCSNYCDLSEPEPSADCGGVGGGQECISAFPEGMVIPGYEDVGICALPE